MSDVNEFLVGGQITPEGREAGLTDEDVAGGQLTPEGRAKIEAKVAAAEKKAKKAKKPAGGDPDGEVGG